MDRYREPPKDDSPADPDPPKEPSIAPTTMLPPLSRAPVPSYPITQAHLLGMSAQDHDLIQRNLAVHIREGIADALPVNHEPEPVDGVGAQVATVVARRRSYPGTSKVLDHRRPCAALRLGHARVYPSSAYRSLEYDSGRSHCSARLWDCESRRAEHSPTRAHYVMGPWPMGSPARR